MATSFLVVPQWQGSVSARAMRLIDGAEAIAGDLPAAATHRVEVPLGAGDALGSEVERLSSIITVRDRMHEELTRVGGPVIVIGGDCGVELASIAHAAGPGTAVVWFDAHADLNTPQQSPSKAFAGMVLRTLLGEGHEALVPERPLEPGRVVLAGVRSVDPAEADYIAASGIRSVPVTEFTPDAVVAAVEATGASSVYLHLDLDVHDPGELQWLSLPEPFGVSSASLVETVRALVARWPLAGAGITQFAPASAADAVDDAPAILRLIGALTSGSRPPTLEA